MMSVQPQAALRLTAAAPCLCDIVQASEMTVEAAETGEGASLGLKGSASKVFLPASEVKLNSDMAFQKS